MTNETFQKLFDKLKDEATNLAISTFKKYKSEATSDAMILLNELKENLKTWTLQLADGQLSKEDFEFLVLGQKELIEMNALKQKGVALIKSDEFKNNLLSLVTNSITSLI